MCLFKIFAVHGNYSIINNNQDGINLSAFHKMDGEIKCCIYIQFNDIQLGKRRESYYLLKHKWTLGY
jgi:hypothetical protein